MGTRDQGGENEEERLVRSCGLRLECVPGCAWKIALYTGMNDVRYRDLKHRHGVVVRYSDFRGWR